MKAAIKPVEIGPPPPKDEFKPPAVRRGIPTKPSHIETDLSVHISALGASANGEIKVSQKFLQWLVEDAVKSGKDLLKPTVTFDPATEQYVIKGKIDLPGPVNPEVTMRMGFTVDNNRLALQFHEISGIGPDSLYAKGVIKGFSKSMARDGMANTPDVKGKKIIFDTEDFLHGSGAIPKQIPIDGKSQKVAISSDGKGNMKLAMWTHHPKETLSQTAASDVAVKLDRDGLARVLTNLFGSDFHVQQVTLRPGGATIGGRAEWAEGAGLGALFVAFAGAATGHSPMDLAMRGSEYTSAAPKISLSLDVRLEGERMHITPSLSAAVDKIADTLKSAGIPHQVHKKDISFSLHDIWGNTQGNFTDAKLDESGLTLKGQINVDSLLDNPPQ